MSNNATALYEERPNHMIIWLDQNIGDPTEYQHLKAAFSSTLDPTNIAPIKLMDQYYYDMLDATDHMSDILGHAWFPLVAFTNIIECMEFFEHNQDKHILFITSESMGQEAIPIILQKFRKTFTDPVTHKPYSSIYVFCHNIAYNIHWAVEYIGYIQMFNFDADLLARMVYDLAGYYLIEGKRLIHEDPPNNSAAYRRLSWAYELYQRYDKLENKPMKKELEEINKLLKDEQEELKSSSDEEDQV